jgi:hypothetical protein
MPLPSIRWRWAVEHADNLVIKALLVVIVAFVFGLGGYWTYYHCATTPTRSMLSEPDGQMEWLRSEFHLTDEQFSRIQQMHREYAPKCDLMCQKIAQANARLDQIISANKSVTPEVEAALKAAATVQEECHQAMFGHVYAVSAAMSPEDGARYLEMMKARIIAPGLSHETVISKSAK